MKKLLILLSFLLLTSCSDTVERFKRIGRAPTLAQVELPPTVEEEQETNDKLRRESHRMHVKKTNSLWQPGSTTFFRDNRAWRVGDIVKVKVDIKDSAKLDNSTQQKRTGSDSLGVPVFFGKQKVISSIVSKNNPPGNLIGTNSARNHNGAGGISRNEVIAAQIATIVKKVLPNGNLVIQGHQEVRVNHELREIKVAGIIRPKDISADNSIGSDQMAEARISYGGKGIVSDMQQPRYGSQIIDIISPF